MAHEVFPLMIRYDGGLGTAEFSLDQTLRGRAKITERMLSVTGTLDGVRSSIHRESHVDGC